MLREHTWRHYLNVYALKQGCLIHPKPRIAYQSVLFWATLLFGVLAVVSYLRRLPVDAPRGIVTILVQIANCMLLQQT